MEPEQGTSIHETEDSTNIFLKTIRKELSTIIGDGFEGGKINLGQKKEIKASKDCIGSNEICTTSINDEEEQAACKYGDSSKTKILEASNISNIDDDIQKMQCSLDEIRISFEAIGESFANINFGCLKRRIKDLRLNEKSTDSIKEIVTDLKQTFDEKYIGNRLKELTEEVASKFRDHPGEFGDIPEICEFFRTCSKLEHGLEKFDKQRDECMKLQSRMVRIAEASYDRVNQIQQNMSSDGKRELEENQQ